MSTATTDLARWEWHTSQMKWHAQREGAWHRSQRRWHNRTRMRCVNSMFSTIVAQVVRARAPQIACNVTRNNALLQRLTA